MSYAVVKGRPEWYFPMWCSTSWIYEIHTYGFELCSWKVWISHKIIILHFENWSTHQKRLYLLHLISQAFIASKSKCLCIINQIMYFNTYFWPDVSLCKLSDWSSVRVWFCCNSSINCCQIIKKKIIIIRERLKVGVKKCKGLWRWLMLSQQYAFSRRWAKFLYFAELGFFRLLKSMGFNLS